jgi:D-serine deaminase-like pyridoxal phosphate-dependent protein
MSSMPDLSALMGQRVEAIDTPSLVIDLDAMERNLRTMQRYADDHSIKLRPHAKMHKSAVLAQQQIAAGAVGICVQKVSEAARLIELGVRDVYLSNEVISLSKCELVARILYGLRAQNIHLSVAVDSLLGIQHWAAALQFQGVTQRVDVFVEIDVGQARGGIEPGVAAVALAQAIEAQPILRFAGLQAYQGKAQHMRGSAARREAIEVALAKVRATIAALQAAGIAVPLVTGAGTGTFIHEAVSGLYGELQAGSYLFMDADYAANERDPAAPVFEHALFVKSQVTSRHSHGGDDRAVIDAGHKSHAIDSGLPKVWSGHAADWQFFNGGDEHGILRGTQLPALGESVWLIPGHCDPSVNLHDHMIGVRGGLAGGVVEQIIRVDTRGCVS